MIFALLFEADGESFLIANFPNLSALTADQISERDSNKFWSMMLSVSNG